MLYNTIFEYPPRPLFPTEFSFTPGLIPVQNHKALEREPDSEQEAGFGLELIINIGSAGLE